MDLDTILIQTTWNDAAGAINNNFSKIKQALLNGGGGGGSTLFRLDSWAEYTADKAGYVLSAKLGYELNTRVSSLETGKKGHIISVSGSGNVLTGVSESADGRTLTFTKGTALTAHQSIYALTIQKNGADVGSYNPKTAAATINIPDVASANTLSTHMGNGTVHITAAERTKWNKVVSDFAAITGSDSDTIINKWEEVVAFLDTYTEADTLANLLGNKVDKVSGKGLSTNDFTSALLTKLNGIEAGANKYVLPTASASVLGGIKVGSGLSISNGVLSSTYSYSLPVASGTTLGGIKVGTRLSIDANGVLSATYTYSLPTASDTVLGGVKVGTTLAISSGVLNLKSGIVTAGNYQKVTVDTYGRVTGGGALTAGDIPQLPWSIITSGKPTTLAGYGITDGANTISISGTGNAFTDISISGHTLQVNKGKNFTPWSTAGVATVNGINNATQIFNVEDGALVSGYNNFWSVINLGSYSQGNFRSQLAMPYYSALADTDLFIRTATGSSWRTWRKVLHDGNTKITSGTITINGVSITPLTSHQSLANYVTLNGAQTITGQKTFSNSISTAGIGGMWISGKTKAGVMFNGLSPIDSSSAWYFYNMKSKSGNVIAFGGLGDNIGFYTFKAETTANQTDSSFLCNTNTGEWYTNKSFTASALAKFGGTASQILMADGSVANKVDNVTGVTHLNWTANATDRLRIPTVNLLAYWNGRFNATTSNLSYCSKGAFGDIVTHSASEFLTTSAASSTYVKKSGDTMTGILKVNDINATDGNGLIAYSGSWIGVDFTSQYGVGPAVRQGVIRSNNTSLIHYRHGVGNSTIWDSGNDGHGSGLNADLLDDFQLGSTINTIPYYQEFPRYTDFGSSTDTSTYFQNILKWAVTCHNGKTWLLGEANPNSLGNALIHIYDASNYNNTGFPRYSSGLYIGLANEIRYFRSYDGVFSTHVLAFTDSNVASSSKWATARTITLTGSVTGSVSIDGSKNVTLLTETNHTHSQYLTSHQTIYDLTIQANGTTIGTFDPNGAAKTINITAANIGAATSGHTHTVKINGAVKTIAPANSGTAVDLGTYLTAHQSLAAYLTKTDAAATYQPKGSYLTEHQAVSNKAATLAWSTTVTVATVGDTDITAKMPAVPLISSLTATSKPNTKLFLVGVEQQIGNTKTSTNNHIYIGTDNNLYNSGDRYMTTADANITNGTITINGTSITPLASAANFVTLDSAQTITANKTFTIKQTFSASKNMEAIYMKQGYFSGFRPCTKVLYSGQYLTASDVVIVMSNSGTTNPLYLVSSPERGQMLLLYHTTTASFTVNGNGKSIRVVRDNTTQTTLPVANRELWMFIFSGTYWEATLMT